MGTDIKIELSLVIARPPLKALADVTLSWDQGEVTIRRCAVFEKPGAPPWASLPRLPIEKYGKRIFAPFIDVSRNLKQRIHAAVLDEYRRKSMRAKSSSPGVSGPQCGQCLGLTTRDSVRQETPGGPMPGLDAKAAEKLRAGQGRRRRPT
jgi:hypothetical protein